MEPVTSEYYEQNAEQYVAETVLLDVRHLYGPFLEHVPLHGHILDAGCGSGRDTLYFLQNGYEVTAFDRSSALVKKARELIGGLTGNLIGGQIGGQIGSRVDLNVQVLSFEEMAYAQCFDGIWACASLLHMPYDALPAVCKKLRRALKPNGVPYCSFKEGLEDWTDAKGRFFVGMTESKLRALLEACGFVVLSLRIETSARQERWLSAVGRK